MVLIFIVSRNFWEGKWMTDKFRPVYYQQNNKGQMEYARALHERIRREFPEVRGLRQ